MPAGIPSSEALTTRQVGAFAIDTSIFQAASFRFHDGQLRQLSSQLPPWLRLWMPDIIAREVNKHRIEAFRRALHQVGSGMNDIARYLEGVDALDLPVTDQLIDVAIQHFDRQITRFIEAHSGVQIELRGTAITEQLFERYFSQLAPFGGGKDKKHEFPDATALLLLEEKAIKEGIQVVLVSADSGWKKYAETSNALYCVSSLPELTQLFESHSPEVVAYKEQIRTFVKSRTLQSEIRNLLNSKLITLPWRFRASGGLAVEIEAHLVNISLVDFFAQLEFLRAWATSADKSACVAELPVDVSVALEIEAFAFEKNRFEGEDEIARTTLIREHEFELTVALEFIGAFEKVAPELAIQKIALVHDPVRVDLGKVQFPGVGPRLWYDPNDMDSDFPF